MKQTMSQQQRKYAMERVAEICKQKVAAIESAMPEIPEKKLSVKDAVKLIQDKKVMLSGKVAQEKSIDNISFRDVFDFSKFHKPRRYNDEKYDKVVFEKKCRPILKQAKEIKDRLMLGDGEEALQLLVAFEK